MKKSFKRAGVAVLSMAMLLSMGAVGAMTANAAKDNTTPIVVTAPASAGASEATYTIYKVCDATPNIEGTHYSYSMATGFSTSIDSILDCADTAAARKALADTLVTDSADASPVGTVTSGNTINLVAGYYLAVMNPTGTTMTAAPILFSLDSEDNASGFTLSTKTSEVSLVKEITAVDKGSVDPNKEDAEGAIGGIVSYSVEATIPAYDSTVTADKVEYYIIDTPSAGLTILDGNVSATVNGAAYTNTTDTRAVATNGTAFASGDFSLNANTDNKIVVTVSGAYVLANAGKKITLTYNAIINDSAAVSTDTISTPNTNIAKLYYDNDYYTASKSGGPDDKDTLEEIDDTTDVYTTKLVFKKLFGGDDIKVADASFTLTGPDYSKSFTTTASQNEFTFTGLQAGTYTLHEVSTNPAYALNTNDITIEIGADCDNTDVYTFTYTNANSFSGESFTMNNTPKGALPGTGGMGTVLFTVGGAAIVLLAGALFVVYLRKRKTEE